MSGLQRLPLVRLLKLLSASDHPWSARWRRREVSKVRIASEGVLGVLLVLFLAEGCTERGESADAGAPDAAASETEDAEISRDPVPEDPAPAPRGPWAVVLVAANDVLNVRAAPRADAAIVAKLEPSRTGVMGTGRAERVGRAIWREVRLGDKTGWVNSAFVTPQIDAARFARDARVVALLDALEGAARSRADIGPLVSERGLYLSVYTLPEWLPPARARALFTDETKRTFDGPACEGCVQGSLRDVVGEAFLDAYDDPDRELSFGAWKAGGNASARLPAKLAGFPFVTVYDPGDLPDAPDWIAVTVFFEYVDDAPKLVGLVLNAWSP